jgi:mono/diheme cytochrome c family protein
LGHCGACHTPRNALGAEKTSNHFDGGEAEGWQAYAINANSYAPIPWSKDALAFYLRHGYQELHGVSRGPMAEVTGNLALLPDSDIDAIATYVVSQMGSPSAERSAKAERLEQQLSASSASKQSANSDGGKTSADVAGQPGAAIYGAACATCHESGRPPPFGGLNFNLSTAVNAPNPQNIINVTLYGLPPADGEASAIMPAFGGSLDDRQVADLLAYLRSRFSDKSPWSELQDLVPRTRDGEYPIAVRPADGIERAPLNVGARELK